MSKIKRNFGHDYKKKIKENKGAFSVFIVLRLLVVAAMVFSCINGNYENLFYCILTLVLFAIPTFVENNFGIELPSALEIVILLFIFAAEILGEMGSYYTKVPYWDTMLHTVNGFLCAAIGFALIDILNRNEKIKFKLSPMFLAIVAFCFSMTIGVLWEFFEFFCDAFLGMDMQKDFVISSITSTYLGESTKNPVVIEDIQTVAVNGMPLAVDGYLDIGLYDTMKDLFVNFIGAVVFSIIGFFYVKTRGRGKIAKQFIPQLKNDKLNEVSEEKAGENK
ncbi:MAG: hypothetical protein IKW64_01225 [Clostridia bacterium]|nr:hypothetical protein [Clostridia bacterium]